MTTADSIDVAFAHATAIETTTIEGLPRYMPVYRFQLGSTSDTGVSAIGIYDAAGKSMGLRIAVYNIDRYRRGAYQVDNRSLHFALIRSTRGSNNLYGYVRDEPSLTIYLTRHGHKAEAVGHVQTKNNGVLVAYSALDEPLYDLQGIHYGLTPALQRVMILSTALVYHLVDHDLLTER